MKHFLYRGQQFRFLPFERGRGPARLPNVIHKSTYDAERKLVADSANLVTGSDYEGWVTQGGGPHDGRRVDLSFKGDLGTMIWEVVEVRKTTSSTGHGPHDVFSGGHQVVVFCAPYTLRFMQSGDYNCVIGPAAIELVPTLGNLDHPDVPGRWVDHYSTDYELDR